MTFEELTKAGELFIDLKKAQDEYLVEIIPYDREPTVEDYNDSLLKVICGALIGLISEMSEKSK